MGRSIYERKQQALKAVRIKLPADVNIYEAMDIASDAIDCYINVDKVRECRCGRVISKMNRTGLCRHCYRNEWRKADQPKRLDALRQRYSRKLRKAL